MIKETLLQNKEFILYLILCESILFLKSIFLLNLNFYN